MVIWGSLNFSNLRVLRRKLVEPTSIVQITDLWIVGMAHSVAQVERVPAAAVAQVVTIDHQALNDARVALQQRQQLLFRLGQLTF